MSANEHPNHFSDTWKDISAHVHDKQTNKTIRPQESDDPKKPHVQCPFVHNVAVINTYPLFTLSSYWQTASYLSLMAACVWMTLLSSAPWDMDLQERYILYGRMTQGFHALKAIPKRETLWRRTHHDRTRYSPGFPWRQFHPPITCLLS